MSLSSILDSQLAIAATCEIPHDRELPGLLNGVSREFSTTVVACYLPYRHPTIPHALRTLDMREYHIKNLSQYDSVEPGFTLEESFGVFILPDGFSNSLGHDVFSFRLG
jgi:hypothetical protein